MPAVLRGHKRPRPPSEEEGQPREHDAEGEQPEADAPLCPNEEGQPREQEADAPLYPNDGFIHSAAQVLDMKPVQGADGLLRLEPQQLLATAKSAAIAIAKEAQRRIDEGEDTRPVYRVAIKLPRSQPILECPLLRHFGETIGRRRQRDNDEPQEPKHVSRLLTSMAIADKVLQRSYAAAKGAKGKARRVGEAATADALATATKALSTAKQKVRGRRPHLSSPTPAPAPGPARPHLATPMAPPTRHNPHDHPRTQTPPSPTTPHSCAWWTRCCSPPAEGPPLRRAWCT